MRRMANVLCHIAAVNVAGTVFRERDHFRVVLLDNATPVPFITGDQPVINLHANESRALLHDQFELYYPLSPTKAMALVHLDNHLDSAVTAEAVRRYNALIVEESHVQVYSNSRELLQIRDAQFAPA